MRTLRFAGQRRPTRSLLASVVAVLTAAALVAAFAVSPGGATPRVGGPRPITLTFIGQVVEANGLSDPGNYPPAEDGYALQYTVPDGSRLVIESFFADVAEFLVVGDPPSLATPRDFVVVGVDTFYVLDAPCEFPGYQRSYDVPLATEVMMGEGGYKGRRAGSLQGPIYVEGGRTVVGAAWAPGGDSNLYVHIVAHGYIEPSSATAPTLPTCEPEPGI